MHTLVAERFATYVPETVGTRRVSGKQKSAGSIQRAGCGQRRLVVWAIGGAQVKSRLQGADWHLSVRHRAGIGDLAALRTHYQTKLAQRRRGSESKLRAADWAGVSVF